MVEEFTKLVHAAVDTKYGDHSISDVRAVVMEALNRFSKLASERALLLCRRPTTDFTTDIINQCCCLYAIERYWRFLPPIRRFVVKVHSVTYGISMKDVVMRTERFVPDYGGDVSWDTQDIAKGMKAIHKKLSEIEDIKNESNGDKGLILADLFSSIIRVHPFADGNGRTARMVVQYCLRFWGDDYLMVPKVRNDDHWKRCVTEGVNGNMARLAWFFAQRIKPRIV